MKTSRFNYKTWAPRVSSTEKYQTIIINKIKLVASPPLVLTTLVFDSSRSSPVIIWLKYACSRIIFIVNKLLLLVRDLEFTDRPSESSAEKPRDFYIPRIDFSQGTAVASNRPIEALASVISFTFVVHSHLIPRKRSQPWTDCLGHKSSMDIASVISFFWLRPCKGMGGEYSEAPRTSSTEII